MRNSIRGLQKWEKEAHEWSRYAGRLRMQAGSGLIGALESYYAQWKEKPTEGVTRDYMLWRLRLHLKWNAYPEFLEELDETFVIGLHDTEPGETYWDVPPQVATGLTDGFNWRKDSGNAIRGGRVGKDEEETVE
jgi:hypothetical protein